MAPGASVALYVALGAGLLAWFAVVVANAWRLVQVLKLEGDDRADHRAWAVWTGSVASLFLGCAVAAVVWGVVESALPPIDPLEDSTGSVQLAALARSNLMFVVISNLLVAIVAGLVFGLSTGAS